MNINRFKIIISIIVFCMLLNCVLPVQASDIDDVWKQGAKFIEDGKSANIKTFNGKKLKEAIMNLYDKFWWAGLAIAAILGTFLGIKFMTQGIEGKAKIKEALVVYIIGCVVIFGSFTIWRIAMNLFKEVEDTATSIPTYEDTSNCNHRWHEYDNVYHQCDWCQAKEFHTFHDNVCEVCGAEKKY